MIQLVINDTIEYVENAEDFANLIDKYMGFDAARYFRELGILNGGTCKDMMELVCEVRKCISNCGDILEEADDTLCGIEELCYGKE